MEKRRVEQPVCSVTALSAVGSVTRAVPLGRDVVSSVPVALCQTPAKPAVFWFPQLRKRGDRQDRTCCGAAVGLSALSDTLCLTVSGPGWQMQGLETSEAATIIAGAWASSIQFWCEHCLLRDKRLKLLWARGGVRTINAPNFNKSLIIPFSHFTRNTSLTTAQQC